MKLRIFVIISILFMLFAAARGADVDRTIQQPRKTTITIQASDPGKPISANLCGIFFEDLNHAADGGLYAELIQNRSFEYNVVEQTDWGLFSFWDLQKLGDGGGFLRLANVRPVHPKNPHNAILAATRPGDDVGMSNDGFDGIPLKQTKPVRLLSGHISRP